MKLLSLTNCRVRFSDPGAITSQVLEIPQLDVCSGELLFVVGRSGQGKTTLLRALAGLQPMELGYVKKETENVRIGLLHQQPQLIPWRTVAENLSLPAELGHINHSGQNFSSLLSALDLRSIDAKLPHQLSVGMRTRVAIIQVVLANPNLLLLDEPTASLDDHTSSLVMLYVQEYVRKNNASAVIVTHDKEVVSQWATAVYHLEGEDVVMVSRKANSRQAS